MPAVDQGCAGAIVGFCEHAVATTANNPATEPKTNRVTFIPTPRLALTVTEKQIVCNLICGFEAQRGEEATALTQVRARDCAERSRTQAHLVHSDTQD